MIYSGTVDGPLKGFDEITIVQHLIAAAGGILLIAGLWTPLMAGLVAVEEASRVLSLFVPQREATWIHVFLAVLSVSMAMLGPGAWSIDARLFGRERFDFDRTRERKPSNLNE